MDRRRWITQVAALAGMAWSEQAAGKDKPSAFAVCYAPRIAAAELKDFDLLVLDPKTRVEGEWNRADKTVLGYVNGAEIDKIHKDEPFYRELEKAGLFLKDNPDWDSRIIDVRSPLWKKRLLEEIIPGVLRKGFDGIFLDTFDSVIDLEEAQPKTYPGMKKAVVELIHAIHTEFPTTKIMVNRALPVAKDYAADVDYLLAESTVIDAGAKKTRLFNRDERQWALDLIETARKKNPKLIVAGLDYADPKDKAQIQQVYQIHRDHQILPYIGPRDLQKIYHMPAKERLQR